jgi:hypothetical protein
LRCCSKQSVLHEVAGPFGRPGTLREESGRQAAQRAGQTIAPVAAFRWKPRNPNGAKSTNKNEERCIRIQQYHDMHPNYVPQLLKSVGKLRHVKWQSFSHVLPVYSIHNSTKYTPGILFCCTSTGSCLGSAASCQISNVGTKLGASRASLPRNLPAELELPPHFALHRGIRTDSRPSGFSRHMCSIVSVVLQSRSERTIAITHRGPVSHA